MSHQGYCQYGGPSTYSNSFSDRRLGAFRINPKNARWSGSTDEKKSRLQHHGNHGRHWHRQCRRPRDVRFSQLNDAVNQNKSLSQATTSQNLLLSLLEADLANHGLGITDAQPACLIDYDTSTNTFQSTCDGGLVSVPSPGIVTCRDDPDSDDALLTLTYRVTATELAAANTGPALTPAQIEAQFAGTSNPLDWVIRHAGPSPIADYPSAAGRRIPR